MKVKSGPFWEFFFEGPDGPGKVVLSESELASVKFAKEGTIRLPSAYLIAGHVEHAYARTTYGVQGATLDIGRYQPSDVSRFEEGYVAITRGREQTRIYVTEGDLEVEDEAAHNATQGDETGLGTGRRRSLVVRTSSWRTKSTPTPSWRTSWRGCR